MRLSPIVENPIKSVNSFKDFIETPFQGSTNAISFIRNLEGDFSEIVNKLTLSENIKEVSQKELLELNLSSQGQLARALVLEDLKALENYGASPSLNIIKQYETDEEYQVFPTDVYSFHVDRSPIPSETILCTYYGQPSEILPNAQCSKKIEIPEIREELNKIYEGPDGGFEDFLIEYYFDLHYQAKTNALPVSLGIGNLVKLAIDHPNSKVLPCVHRAPKENDGQFRLLLIC